LTALYESIDLSGDQKAVEVKFLAKKLAQSTGGYVAADISTLLKEGSQLVGNWNSSLSTQLSSSVSASVSASASSLSLSDQGNRLLHCLLEARSTVPPSCLRGDLVKVPQVPSPLLHPSHPFPLFSLLLLS
jgi:hypothetical protein